MICRYLAGRMMRMPLPIATVVTTDVSASSWVALAWVVPAAVTAALRTAVLSAGRRLHNSCGNTSTRWDCFKPKPCK